MNTTQNGHTGTHSGATEMLAERNVARYVPIRVAPVAALLISGFAVRFRAGPLVLSSRISALTLDGIDR